MKLKNILKEAINEMGYNDIHFKNVFSYWQSANELVKREISDRLVGYPDGTAQEIVNALLDMGHQEIQDLENEFNITIRETSQQK